MRLMWNTDEDAGSIRGSRKTVTFEGKFYRLHDAHPGPSPHHRIEIWVGAQGPRMLRLIGRIGDGWSIPLQSYLPSDRINAAQKIIDEAAQASGRCPRSIRRIRGLAGIIDEEGRLDRSLHGQGEIVVGSPDEWVDELMFNVNSLGVDSFVFWPASEGDELHQIHLFAEKVVPHVNERIGGSA
jgi:alkanesulfonate monooxygenase SsuD/methylene tetrahydromethanopterin reductase-like flavin-dependent oxidoreductase (luciferase family)